MKPTNTDIRWIKRYVDAEMKSVRRAVDKVEKTNENYREQQNEWRGQIKDTQGLYVTRRELWAAVVAIIAVVLGIMSYLK